VAFLPRDEVLPDGAVVVKGGVLGDPDGLRESAQDYFDETEREAGEGIYGVSVCSLPERDAKEILLAIPKSKRLPHSKIRQATVGALRACGYDVSPSGWFGHATLKLMDLPTEDDWRTLNETFAQPERNPVRKSL
jgi:hypothetical protein